MNATSARINRLITRRRVIATAVVLVVLAAALVLWPRGGKGDAYGYFADASPLDVGSEVRASGVRVGSVASIELDGKVAKVGLDLDDGVLPLHEDATMTIRPINLLGENFVQLDVGSPDAPELGGDTVAIEQTNTDVTLQALLDTFDDPTAAGLAALVSELGTAVDGRGGELAAAIEGLGPAMDQIDAVGDVLRSQNETLSHLVATADPVAKAVKGRSGERLDRLIEQTTAALYAVAAQKTGLQDTIAELPSTLTEARETLTSLRTVADNTTPTLREARPVTSDLEQIAREIQDFSVEATPAFAGFDGVFAEADRLLVEAAPVIKALRQTAPGLSNVAENAQPASRAVLDESLGDLMSFVRKWSLSTNGRDAISHYFRGVFHVTPASINDLLGNDVIPEVVDAAPGDGASDNPLDVVPDLPVLPGLPDLNETLDDTLAGVGGLLGNGGRNADNGGGGNGGLLAGLLGKQQGKQRADASSATGLTSSQEQQLLTQLLGTTGGQ